ncbi:hypothetical protein JCM9140_22 [Halalkalibacter wakoensis JCM 9140]|uniref:Medium/long-chain acyl-CoA thioesterase YigI n=1 Tax=Halalkalibacter wakoensis JCM 9140 TaxID=1236970 RepID=W4PWJ7_9BACI|nr:PaaI family thioesterase [Halalkalibacter wakoensis]GAE24117.1 hypothetical protein JCM9140_22 [Halalkalibacter wakoensis JCM 9140]
MSKVNQDLATKTQQFLDQATAEEMTIVSNLIDGLSEKRDGKYHTYLAAITQISSCFLENGDYEIKLPIQPLIMNPLNMLHGGMTATLLDTTMGSLVNRSLPTDLAAVTSEMNIHFIKPGVGEYVRCIATITHRGTHTYISEAKVYDEREKLIAMATGTFFILNKPTQLK